MIGGDTPRENAVAVKTEEAETHATSVAPAEAARQIEEGGAADSEAGTA
jgi:hypothetical protein